MKRPLTAWVLSLAIVGAAPPAFAEVFTLPISMSTSIDSGDTRIAPGTFEQLSPEQQNVIRQRLREAERSEFETSDRSASLEAAVAGHKPDGLTPSLEPFGYDLFAQESAFKPIEGLPVPDNYVVGAGDEIVISVQSPRRSGDYTLVVTQDGKIHYPNIGALSVAGMGHSQMVAYLTRTIKGSATDMNLSIRLGKQRSIEVLVVGHVKRPGIVKLSAFASLSNAVMASGGPSKAGSLRSIQLKRSGKLITKFDYYDLLTKGDTSKDVPLQPGDVIFVPPTGPMVSVAGNVKSPAIYELAEPSYLKDVLSLAGGITPMGYAQQIQIERFEANQVRKVLDVDLEKLGQNDRIPLKNGDGIKVFSINQRLSNAVYVDGNVERPGKHQYRPGMRVRDIIRSEKDLKPESYLEFGLIERVMEPDFHTELIPFHLGKALAGVEAENKRLMPEDRLRIYYRWDIQQRPMVRIAGAVNRTGEYQLRPNMTVVELLHLAGGLQDSADRQSAELTRVQVINNQLQTKRLSINLQEALQGKPSANPVLEKDDYLLVKPIADYKRYRTITLLGEVAQPGAYTFRQGESLYDLLQRAGGLTSRAYVRGAVFTRESVKRLQEERLQEFAVRLEQNLHRQSAQAIGSALSQESANANQEVINAKKALLESIKQTKASGRMIVNLEQLLRNPHSPADVQLEEGDVMLIPPQINSVSVLGQVYNPTAITHEPGRKVEYYLSKTGGPAETADSQGIYVVKADGTVLTDKNFHTGWGPWRRGVLSATLDPGDTVMVPEKITVDNSLRDIRDITQILFQMATTAALTWTLLK